MSESKNATSKQDEPDVIFYPGRTQSFYIGRPKSARMPTQFCALCVDVEQKHDLLYNPAPVQASRIQAWFWREEKGKCGYIFRFDSCRQQAFWNLLYKFMNSGGTWHVFGWDMWLAWCVLDGRTQIDNNELSLDAIDYERVNSINSPRKRSGHGLFVAEDPPTIISLARRTGGRVKFLDLANYGIEPNALKGLNISVPADIFGKTIESTAHAIKGYGRLIKENELGGWQTTAASQAWYCFRQSHMKHRLITNPMKKVLQLEQAAYYAGRTECKFIGEKNEKTYHIDVNSLYTALAVTTQFPREYVCTKFDVSADEAKKLCKEYICCADVVVNTEEACLPWAGYNGLGKKLRRNPDDIILFQTGEFRTALCGQELEYALEGKVNSIKRIQCYTKCKLLEDWGRWALATRMKVRNSDLKWLEPCVKKVINCLPGKFGQRKKRWVKYKEDKKKKGRGWSIEWGAHPEHGYLTQFRTIGGVTEYADEELLADQSCPIVSGCWTAAGRMFLWGAILFAGSENVWYYNTDSLVLNQDGFDRFEKARLISQHEPLKWKVREIADSCEIRGINNYRIGKRYCTNGPFGQESLSFSPTTEWMQQESLTAQLRGKNACEPVMVKLSTSIQKGYRHGKVMKDGTVAPFQSIWSESSHEENT